MKRGAWRAKSFKVMLICAVNALPYGALSVTAYSLALEQQVGVLTLVIIASSGCLAGVATVLTTQKLMRRKTLMVSSACIALFFLALYAVMQHASADLLLVKAALVLTATGVIVGFVANYTYMFEKQETKVIATNTKMIVSGFSNM